VPPYLEYRTTSPSLTSSGRRWPSSKRPGPTARTTPSCGFSLAVSGMTRPEAVVCSASSGLTTTRSSSGLMATVATVVTSPSETFTDGGNTAPPVDLGPPSTPVVAGARGTGWHWHTHGESANRQVMTPAGTRSTRVPKPGHADCASAADRPLILANVSPRHRTASAADNHGRTKTREVDASAPPNRARIMQTC